MWILSSEEFLKECVTNKNGKNAGNGTCILVITHDREFINIVADKVLNIEA